jgi:hypothetical protein
MEIKLEFGSFCIILTLIFVVAKLFKAIDWSWWWIFSPLWIPVALIIGFLIIMLIVAGIIAIIDHFKY